MARVPNSEPPEQNAKRFLREFDRQNSAIRRRRAYRWTTGQDELSADCVMVGIGGPDASTIGAGLSYTEPTAGIYWGASVGQRIFQQSGGELGPLPVLDALDRADEISRNFGYNGVVILLNERGIWRDEWGALAEEEGIS